MQTSHEYLYGEWVRSLDARDCDPQVLECQYGKFTVCFIASKGHYSMACHVPDVVRALWAIVNVSLQNVSKMKTSLHMRTLLPAFCSAPRKFGTTPIIAFCWCSVDNACQAAAVRPVCTVMSVIQRASFRSIGPRCIASVGQCQRK